MAPIFLNNLVVRDDDTSVDNSTTYYLLIALTVLLLVGFFSICALFLLKYIHRWRQQQQQQDNNSAEKAQPMSHRRNRHPPSISITSEKATLLHTESGPTSPVPEIHITFPEEEGHDKKRQSGRVVVVRISETGGVGLEPYEEQLPAYQKEDGSRFHSLDLERLGGLKEKEHQHL